mmetsp:Transcript_66959/g.217907  ORF Transcript_66959/g.217907 Transcript_66959/m.217907 type:complete len:219 (+) Transcript_66959:104-760(+)
MTLGAGVFTIPMVYNALGYVHASLWVVAMGIFADIAMERLLDISVQHSKDCYNALSELAFGAAGKTMMSAITLVTTFIAGLSYICTAKESEMLDPSPSSYRSGIRMWLVIVIGAAMVLVDAFVPTKIAFTLCGALGLSMGAYVVPCVLFLRLNSSGRTAKLLRVATLVVLVFGLTLLFGSTPVTVVNALGEKGGAAARKLMDLLCGHLSADPTLNFEL